MSEVPASCIAWDEDLSALIDEELSVEREAELRAHLDGCSRCALRLEELCNVDLTVAGLPAPEVPGDLRQRLAARIATEAVRPAGASEAAPPARARTLPPEHRPRWAAARLAGLGAAAAALLLAVWVAVRSDAPLQPEPSVAGLAPRTAIPEVPALEPSAPLPEPQAAQIALEEPAAPPAPAVVSPEVALDAEPPVEMAEVGLPELADLEEEDVALLVEFEAVEDFDVIANLELLERFLDAEAAGGAG